MLEFKAARLVMQGGNLEQSQLRDLIEKNRSFLFAGEEADFQKCPQSGKLLEEYPTIFLEAESQDLQFQGGLSAKLASKGLIKSSNKRFGDASIRFTSIAAREDLVCVLAPSTLIIDHFAICDAAKVDAMSVADFIQWLKDTAP